MSDAVPTLPYCCLFFVFCFFLPHLENVALKWREINLALIPSYLVTLKEDFLLSALLLRQTRCHNRNRLKLPRKSCVKGSIYPAFIYSASQLCSDGGFKSEQQLAFFFACFC